MRTTWDATPTRAQARHATWFDVRIPDLILCALVPLNNTLPGAPGNVPLPELAVMALALLASNRRPDLPHPRPLWFPALLVAAWGMLALSSVLNDVDGTRRLVHMANFVILALILSSGRIHTPSALRGFALGIAVAGASGLVNQVVPIFSSGYGDRLTGVISDPNTAGYYFTVFGCLGLVIIQSPRVRAAVIAAMAVTTLLTLSRTSIFGLVLALAWLGMRRLGWGKAALALLVGCVWTVGGILDELRLWGPFATREGSDELRERIIAGELELVAVRPWVGNGAGTALVDLEGDTFFFHNSALGLRAEGGWLLVGICATLITLVALALLRRRPTGHQPWIEMALLSACVMGVSLGEVYLELPMAAALGIAIRHLTHPDGIDLACPPPRRPLATQPIPAARGPWLST